MASEWFVKTGKGVSGPFSTSQMADFARTGKLGPAALCSEWARRPLATREASTGPA